MNQMSQLQKARLQFQPVLPSILKELLSLDCTDAKSASFAQDIKNIFPKLALQEGVSITKGAARNSAILRVGIVLSGGQASGGHNVVAGVFDALKTLNPQSELIGFLNGPSGIVNNQTKPITEELLSLYRNQGGFDIIGSGRTKIETTEQFASSLRTVRTLNLDGLVVVGGDDSNTNAAFLAEYFLANGCKTKVIGVPKTIDGDLQNASIEMSFGFDSACKIYSETIGNICRDALSAKKYYYFIKLMGRSASHITLECALATQANFALIGEEVQQQQKTLAEIVGSIADLIVERKKQGKEYGVILIPEGIIEFIEDCKSLIAELNTLLATVSDTQAIVKQLSAQSAATFSALPQEIQQQLLLDRDPHGNVQVSKIETEKLFIALVELELAQRKKAGAWNGKFTAQPIFCGYEGRSCLPSNFDCNYCYALGVLTALLIARNKTGYIVSFKDIAKSPHEWQPAPVLLPTMIHMEERGGKQKAVISKTLVDLQGKVFKHFKTMRNTWRLDDCYLQPGPIQFWGPDEIVNRIAQTITLSHA